MMDRHRPSVPENRTSHHSRSKSNPTSRSKRGGKKNCPSGQVDIIAMVRSLQRTAGMTDCFRMGNVDCDVIDCDWRAHCLGTPSGREKNGEKPSKVSKDRK